jgi:hypothetical protein
MAPAEPLKFSAGSFFRAGVWGSSERSNFSRKRPAMDYLDGERGDSEEDGEAVERPLEAHVRNCKKF